MIKTNLPDIPVLYEDESVVVIDKPAAVMVHEDGVSNDVTVIDWLLARTPGARGVGEPGRSKKGEVLERSGVVHRLDRDTSGVMVLVKTQAAFEHVKAQFQERTVKKEYRAFVYGAMREPWGTIQKKIGRSPSDFRKRSAMPGAKGTMRDAVTDWERIGTAHIGSEHFSYLKLMPKTGRTHQLRVHLRAIERPIIGDVLYADHMMEHSSNLSIDRLALHAYKLTFTLPSGDVRSFMAPLPLELERAAERIAEG